MGLDTLETLAEFSRRLGADHALVQGGGGNTSLKVAGRMWIKASGLALAEVTARRGFVAVDDAAIRKKVSAARTEADYNALLTAHKIDDPAVEPGRPSLETGFHALLDKAVLHSHSVWANLLTCAADGEARVCALFPSALWVGYTAPGLPLTQTIEEALAKHGPSSLLFLQNHGVIANAPTLEEAWALQGETDAKIRAAFGLDPESYAANTEAVEADGAHVLFPDQAVYLTNAALRDSVAGVQTLQAYSFIRQTLESRSIALRYLAVEDVAFLLNMDAEKYRQQIAVSG